VGVKIGVLALQGDVSEHIEAFENAIKASGSKAPVQVLPVRGKQDLEQVDALALPGGESTTISRLIGRKGLLDALIDFDGGIFATCAGMVIMACNTDDSRVHTLDRMDMSVKRNAFGRQRESFEADIEILGFNKPFHAVFIRAPIADRVGPDVKVIGSIAEGAVALEKGMDMALSFHPELGDDPRLHIRFLKNCGLL
jgi:5'-phosphate synthase pdxT subunit